MRQSFFALFYFMEQIPHWNNLSLENLTQVFEGITYTEEWKDIKDYEGYYKISSFGRIKSIRMVGRKRENNRHKKIKILKLNLTLGYPHTQLSVNGIGNTLRTHILVGSHFIPNPENKPEINHKYGITTEAMFFVLEWSTRQENIDHAIITGLFDNKGSKNGGSKLSEESVWDIAKSNLSKKELAKKYNVSRYCINEILIGLSWSHLTGIKHIKKPRRKFTKSDIVHILTSGKGSWELCQEYNVDCSTISHIKSGRYYKEIFKEVNGC